jgi:hypothetical protein
MSGQIYLNRVVKASANGSVGSDLRSSVLEILATRLAAPIDDATRNRATRHVLDWLASAQLGMVQSSAGGFVTLAAESEPGRCRTVAGKSADWWQALQLNAALGNIMEP